MVTYNKTTLAVVAITTAALGLAVASIGIQLAAAQELDKDKGASSFAPRADPDRTAGGWMPMEAPGRVPDLAAENSPGQQGLEAGIIGPDLKK